MGKAAAVLFAVGAVSGTVLSFEMGMLWPGLLGTFGDVIGLPFALEGVFFVPALIWLFRLTGIGGLSTSETRAGSSHARLDALDLAETPRS